MPQAKPRMGKPPASEFGQLRAHLARHKVQQADIKDAIGTGAQGRSRAEIVDQLRAWLKTRPKGE